MSPRPENRLDPRALRELRRMGQRSPMLAWGLGEPEGDGARVWVVALRDALAVRGPDGSWMILGWHEILRGGWRSDEASLWWVRLSGGEGGVRLSRPGELPVVFRERVAASIALEERIDAPGGAVLITARRPPEPAPTIWHTLALGEADLSDPATGALVVAETVRLRHDYPQLG